MYMYMYVLGGGGDVYDLSVCKYIYVHMYLPLGTCSVSQFRCYYGYCINSNLTCNGAVNCYYGDRSDERGCGTCGSCTFGHTPTRH